MPSQKSCLAECSDGENGSTEGECANGGEKCSCSILGGRDLDVRVLPVASTGESAGALRYNLCEHSSGCGVGYIVRLHRAPNVRDAGRGAGVLASAPAPTSGEVSRTGSCACEEITRTSPVVGGIAVSHAHSVSVVDPEIVLVVVVLLPFRLVPPNVKLTHASSETGGGARRGGIGTRVRKVAATSARYDGLERLRDTSSVACESGTTAGATEDGSLVVVGAGRIALSCTLCTADLSIDSTSFDVSDLPLGFRASNNS